MKKRRNGIDIVQIIALLFVVQILYIVTASLAQEIISIDPFYPSPLGIYRNITSDVTNATLTTVGDDIFIGNTSFVGQEMHVAGNAYVGDPALFVGAGHFLKVNTEYTV